MSEDAPATNTSTELARERNRAAEDRTLMAWIRTSLSLIGFGFGIGKFYDYLQEAGLRKELDPIHSTRLMGGAFIILGVLGLLAAVIQHCRMLQRIKRREFEYVAPLPLTLIVAVMLLLIGLFAFVAILL